MKKLVVCEWNTSTAFWWSNILFKCKIPPYLLDNCTLSKSATARIMQYIQYDTNKNIKYISHNIYTTKGIQKPWFFWQILGVRCICNVNLLYFSTIHTLSTSYPHPKPYCIHAFRSYPQFYKQLNRIHKIVKQFPIISHTIQPIISNYQ